MIKTPIIMAILLFIASPLQAEEFYYVIPENANLEELVAQVEENKVFKGFAGIRWQDILPPGSEKGTLVICGEHNEPLVVPEFLNDKALSISGNCFGKRGRIQVAGGGAMILKRPHIQLEQLDLASDEGVALRVENSDISITDVVAENSSEGLKIVAKTEIKNIIITDSFVKNNKIAGILLHETSPEKIYQNITLSGNKIINNGSQGIRIWFFPTATKSSLITNLKINDNEVTDNKGDGIVIVHQYVDENNPEPIIKDVEITNNLIERNTGGIAIRGVTSSKWFETSKISGNFINNNEGVTGGINIFWSQGVLISENRISNNKTKIIDGNGVLVDHGNKHIHVKNNIIEGHLGNNIINSGVGVMVLDNEDIVVENNSIIGNWVGIFLGGRAPSKNIVIKENKITDTRNINLYFDRGYDKDQVVFYNNKMAPIDFKLRVEN
ncbi:MAG: right-handed parallel beta-helix repeat-containing protein [Proteobacteria bacterium]|nr:right-handed parallel beta-helix repeat-containing protein [Pseudomonadota bacterium]